MNATSRPQRLYRYVIDHDKGFAPNPFFRYCTLACCKPDIRKHAIEGDVIVGFGPSKFGMSGQIIYWMTVEEKLSFQQYWEDPRFQIKKPRTAGSFRFRFGDNIYHRASENDPWIQEASFHSDMDSLDGLGNYKRDTGKTDKVLIATEFAYWGRSGPQTPERFEPIVKRGRGLVYNVDDPTMQVDFIEWLRSLPQRGFLSDPSDWHYDQQIKFQLEEEQRAC